MAHERFQLAEFMRHHRLPEAFASIARNFYAPLADWVEKQLVARGRSGYVLGINGAQGTGKSTLSNYLAQRLGAVYDRRVVELSIDDIYLTRSERERLARDVHPLLVTRGVPGTHDIALGIETIEQLRNLGEGEALAVPRFDKAQDDQSPRASWPLAEGPVDLIVLEGWCVGSTAQPASELDAPINTLEKNEDPDGQWRRFVNDALATSYPPLFDLLDSLVYIAAPDFDAVFRWRMEQEQKLRERVATTPSRVQSDEEIVRFVHHFERLTRHNFATLPERAAMTLTLNDDHQAVRLD